MGVPAVTKTFVLIGIFALTGGCAFTSHQVNVAVKQPATVGSTIEKPTTIRLSVVDERDEKDLGHRGAGIAAAKVTVEGLMPTFTSAVEEGFRKKGYTLTSAQDSAGADLLVSLRALKFDESAGFFTVGSEADATILVEAHRGSANYRNQYRSSDEDRQVAISFGGGIDQQVNEVLSNALSQLLSDSKLDSFLVGE